MLRAAPVAVSFSTQACPSDRSAHRHMVALAVGHRPTSLLLFVAAYLGCGASVAAGPKLLTT
jgi:hypothetical protein